MTKNVTLNNDSQHPRRAVLDADNTLRALLAIDQKAFLRLLAVCRTPSDQRFDKVDPLIRDVLVSSMLGENPDEMSFVWPIRLTMPVAGQQIETLDELDCLEINGFLDVQLNKWRDQPDPTFARLFLFTPTFEFADRKNCRVHLQIREDGRVWSWGLDIGDLEKGTQIFVAQPDDLLGLTFSGDQPSATWLQRARDRRAPRLMSGISLPTPIFTREAVRAVGDLCKLVKAAESPTRRRRR